MMKKQPCAVIWIIKDAIHRCIENSFAFKLLTAEL